MILEEIMNKTVVTVEMDDSLEKVQKISCLPVVDGENRPIGILSWRDILKWIWTEGGIPAKR